jgi:hypothetical protein
VAGNLFVPEKPRVWIAKFRPIVQANGVAWDLAADGKRAAMVTSLETAASTPDHEVVFLLNFFDELRRRAPLGK